MVSTSISHKKTSEAFKTETDQGSRDWGTELYDNI